MWSFPQHGINFVNNFFPLFYPLDSMLKVMLSVYVSLMWLASYSQSAVPEIAGPTDVIIEDPNKIIQDLNSANTDNGKLNFTWRVKGSFPEFFAIERSDNGKSYEVVAVLNNLTKQDTYQWTDEAPVKGKSFYRIAYSFNNTKRLYSKTISVAIAGYIAFKFYPNPVDHILIVRSDVPIDIHILDATGKIRISQLHVEGLATINVSSLEKGIYVIRFSNKLTNVMSQEKLIKN
jgi:hypothetical protein